MNPFSEQIATLFQKFGVSEQPPLEKADVEEQLSLLAAPQGELIDFYLTTNGLEKEWFKIFPLEDKEDPNKTWDSIQRANDHTTTAFLRENKDLLSRFLVFASISGGNCAVIDRTDGSLWYQDQGLHQTDMSLIEFIEIELREVSEL